MKSVFISHNYNDKPLARKIARALNMYGVETWIDEAEIRVGDSLIKKISEGIEHVDYLIALISQSSINSEWVNRELDIAINKEIENKRVIVLPVLAGKCQLPDFLKGKLYADMSTNAKFKQQLPLLMRRFDITVQDSLEEQFFTSKQIPLVTVIKELSSGNKEVQYQLLSDISYKDEELFGNRQFLDCFSEFIEENIEDEFFVHRIVELFSYIKDVDTLPVVRIIETIDEPELQKLLKNLGLNHISNSQIEQSIYDRLIGTGCDALVSDCITYFAELYVLYNDDVEKLLTTYCLQNLSFDISVDIFGSMCNYLLSHNDSGKNIGQKKIIELWEELSDDKKLEEYKDALLQSILDQGSNFTSSSPRLRRSFRDIVFGAFSDDEMLNGDIIVFLLLQEDERMFPRKEVWEKIEQLDDFSIIVFLEKLDLDYVIYRILDKDEDYIGLEKLLKRSDSELRDDCLGVIAKIDSPIALEILKKEDFTCGRVTDIEIITTILHYGVAGQYMSLFISAKEQILQNPSFVLFDLLKLAIAICEYEMGNGDINSIKSIIMQNSAVGTDIFKYRRQRLVHAIESGLERIAEDLEFIGKKNIQRYLQKIKDFD